MARGVKKCEVIHPTFPESPGGMGTPSRKSPVCLPVLLEKSTVTTHVFHSSLSTPRFPGTKLGCASPEMLYTDGRRVEEGWDWTAP